MEKRYLDPQTVRKVEIVKQQLNMEYKKYQVIVNELASNKNKQAHKGKV